MNRIKKVVVCLDLTEMDDLLIQYVAFLCRKINHIEQVLFVHNIKFESATEAQSILSQLDKPLKELVVEVVSEKTKLHFQETKIDYKVLVEETLSTPEAIAKIALVHQSDLVIMGKKLTYRGSGLVAEKLLRVADFDKPLLLIPETAHHNVQKILVPTDFSKTSTSVVQIANYFRQQTKAALSCQHVFSIPAIYFPTIIEKDLEHSLQKNARKKWEQFYKGLLKVGVFEIECELTFNHGKTIAQSIYDHAVKFHKDLIVIGVKNRKSPTSFMIGRVATQLIQYDLHIPLLIIK